MSGVMFAYKVGEMNLKKSIIKTTILMSRVSFGWLFMSSWKSRSTFKVHQCMHGYGCKYTHAWCYYNFTQDKNTITS